MLSCAVIAALLLIAQVTPPARSVSGPDLLEASRMGRTARARELIAGGADVNAPDWRGFTPLMWAAATGNLPLVEELLQRGARVDARARDGSTALVLAASNGYIETVRLLLSRGADVSAGPAGETARARAGARGHNEVAALLEAAEQLGALLVQAVSEGQSAAARQLLARGAPFNTRNDQGVSATMFAARNGDLGMLQFLLARGADAAARDNQGETVFDWAQRSPATAPYVVAFLRDRGITRDPGMSPATSSAPQVRSSLANLQRLLSSLPRQTDAVRRAHARAAAALTQLLALSASWPADSPEDYRVNLAQDVQVLESAMVGAGTGLSQTLEALADDLETKLEHCRKSGGKLGGSVRVRVRTVQDGEEVRSWQVFYMPKIFEVSATATPDLFPQLSSPTEELLVPGRYVMWARRPGFAAVSVRTVVKIGEGRSALVIDLPVPPSGSQ
jgi:ankyrin repeat protein